jgi:hypothetical protein
MEKEEITEIVKVKTEVNSNIHPQEIITVFRDMELKDGKQHITYPEIEKFLKEGYYVENFKQLMIGTDKFMTTFILKKTRASAY